MIALEVVSINGTHTNCAIGVGRVYEWLGKLSHPVVANIVHKLERRIRRA